MLAGISATMTSLALLVVGLFALVAHNLSLGLTSVEERVAIIGYLDEAAREQDVVALQALISGREDVESVRFISKEEALREVRSIPEFGDLFDGLETNPLPASIEVRMAVAYRDPASLDAMGKALETYPLIEDVQYGGDWVDKVFLLRRIAGLTTLFLGGGFALVGALIIAAAVRVAVYARREETHIMRLVGARDSFIRLPFLLEGAITGTIGGFMALLLTWISYRIAGSAAFDAIGNPLFQPVWIPASWVLLGIAAGAIIGTISVAFALRSYLREL